MAHLREWLSPYNFSQNNPINRVDLTGALDDWVQDADGCVYWDNNAISQATTKAGETYLGAEGYGVNELTGAAIHYKPDGTIQEFSQTLREVTVTDNGNVYQTANPSIGSHNKTGIIWNERDLNVYNTLKDHNSPIGREIRKQVHSGNFDILDARRYWDENGHTLGNMKLLGFYIPAAVGLASSSQSLPNPQAKQFNFNKRITHSVARALLRGVKEKDIIDALNNPLKIMPIKYDNIGRPSQTYIGLKATVVKNPITGKRISSWATGAKTLKKLTNGN